MTSGIVAEVAFGLYVPAALGVALNIGSNIYPIMLQRYNRGRLYNTLELIEEKKMYTL